MGRHFNFANVVSLLALFFALTGGSYAAVSADTPLPAASSVGPAGTGLNPAPQTTVPEASSVAPAEVADAPAVDPTAEPTAESTEADAEVAKPSAGPQAEGPAAGPPEHSTAPTAHKDSGQAHKDSGEESNGAEGGPPPWAPAYGYRCQQDAAPGSDAFHACIESSKP